MSGATGRAPTREELDSQLTATQQDLAKLREAQEQLERAKAAIEEMRRRRAFETPTERKQRKLRSASKRNKIRWRYSNAPAVAAAAAMAVGSIIHTAAVGVGMSGMVM